MKVWVLTARSESSDEYGPWVFRAKPTRKALREFLEKKCPLEFEEMGGPGEWGSYLHIALKATELL